MLCRGNSKKADDRADDNATVPTGIPDAPLVDDVWELVLNSTEDSNSVYNTFLSNPHFWDAFRNKIPLWLFAQVLPHLLPYLTRQEARRCTQICKTWRNAVFKFVEDHPYRRPYIHDRTNTIPIIHSPYLTAKLNDFEVNFQSPEAINQFLEANPNNFNPFIGRSISIDPDPWSVTPEDFHHFTNAANTFLRNYGKHIWYFKISSYQWMESPAEFYQRLSASLSHLPNLRYLHVKSDDDTTPEAEDLQQDPTGSPFPLLPNLESLKLEFVENALALNIFIALMRSYATDHLHYLSLPLPSWGFVMEELQFDLQLSLDGLKDLQLVGANYLHADHFINLIMRLSKESLKKIEFPGMVIGNPNQFYQLLDGYQITLLDLAFPPFCLGEFCNMECEASENCTTWETATVINMPNLQTLRVQHDLYRSYKYLTKIPSLENLEIRQNVSGVVTSPEEGLLRLRNSVLPDIPRYGCYYDQVTEELHKWIYQEHDMDKSLVWKLLPELKHLKLSFGFWQRDDMEARSHMSVYITRVYMYRRKEFSPK